MSITGSRRDASQKELVAQKELEVQNRLLKLWDIEVLRGIHPSVSRTYKTFAVKFTSRQFDGDSKTFLEDDLEKGSLIIRELKAMGSFKRSDFGAMLDYVDSCKEEGKVTEVKSLVDFTNDMISESTAQELFDDLVDAIIENREFFPTLSSKDYLLGGKFGVLLDKDYKDKFRLSDDDAAFGVNKEFLYDFLGVSDYRDTRYREVINGWANHGFLSRVTKVKGRHAEFVSVGGDPTRFYLFCIRGYQSRLRQAVEGVQA